jgi:hypothetical protein
MRPDDLIASAWKLLHVDDDSMIGPTEADNRRAASTAYFALFHAICQEAVTCLAVERGGDNFGTQELVYRALDHGSAKRACEKLERTHPLASVATTFVDLQDLRHDADYAPGNAFLLMDVGSLVIRSSRAIDALVAAQPDVRPSFVLKLVIKKRG